MLIAASVMNRCVGVGRHVHDEHVANPPRRAQAGLGRSHLAHQLVRVQAALHQQVTLSLSNQLDSPRRSGVAVRRVDDLIARDVKVELARDIRDLCRGPDQNRFDDAGLGGVDGAAERDLVARMDHDRRCRRHLLGGHDQALIFRAGRLADRPDRRDGGEFGFLGGEHELVSSAKFLIATRLLPGVRPPVGETGAGLLPPQGQTAARRVRDVRPPHPGCRR
jgi:hypothetical protein